MNGRMVALTAAIALAACSSGGGNHPADGGGGGGSGGGSAGSGGGSSGSSGGGGTTGQASVGGVAASGRALAGAAVTLKDSAGTSHTATTASDGTYSINTTGLSSPFLVLATAASGAKLYSVSADANATTTINVTPLTDTIIRTWYGVQGVSMDAAFGNLTSNPPPAPLEVEVIGTLVQGIVQGWLEQAGVANAASINLISTPFQANGSGVDGVLDKTTVAIGASGVITIALTNSSSQLSQTSTVTPSTAGSVTVSTTQTTGSGTTSPVTSSTVVPTNSNPAAASAISGVTATLTNFVNTVNQKGASLVAADLAAFVDPNFTNDGQSASAWEAELATGLAGTTMTFTGLQINSLDTTDTPNTADVSFQSTMTNGGQASTQVMEFDFKLLSGTWFISGNGRVASASATTWGWSGAQGAGYTKSLRFDVADPRGVVSGVTVSGLMNGTTTVTTVPIVCGGSTGVSCGTAYGNGSLNAFQLNISGYWPPIPATYTLTLTTTSGPQVYTCAVDATFGFNAAGPVPADYPMMSLVATPSLSQLMAGVQVKGSVYVPVWVTGQPRPPHFNYESFGGTGNSVSNIVISGTWDAGVGIAGQMNPFTITVPAAVVNHSGLCAGSSNTCYNITFRDPNSGTNQTGDIDGAWFGMDACDDGNGNQSRSCTNNGVNTP